LEKNPLPLPVQQKSLLNHRVKPKERKRNLPLQVLNLSLPENNPPQDNLLPLVPLFMKAYLKNNPLMQVNPNSNPLLLLKNLKEL